MKKRLMFSAILIVQMTMAQQPTDVMKVKPQNQPKRLLMAAPRPTKLISQIEGINQDWVKDYQRRAREYLLKTRKISLPNEPLASRQTIQPANQASAEAVSVTPIADIVREVPFASKNNTIELSIQNNASTSASDISVEVTDVPSWLVFSTRSFHIGAMAGKEEKTTTLAFSVDKLAPVGQEESLTLAVESSSGQTWTKEMRIKVAPPAEFELFQNYPNPFNPATTISYQLSTDSKVSLKIYDVLGREVMTLAEGEQQAGYHQGIFDASRFASGMYIYRIVHSDASGKELSAQKRMLLVK